MLRPHGPQGDLTGIEIISRTTEQVFKRRIPVLEETRAVELLLDAEGQTVTGALLYNMRHADFIVVEAAATLVATGGGPTQYRFHAPGPESRLTASPCSTGRACGCATWK